MYPDLEEAECFISMFCFHYSLKENVLTYANAGHNYPLLFHAQQTNFSELDADGMLVGVLDDAEYEEKKISVEPGDFLVLYTDGLTEPKNQEGEEYSLGRMKSFFESRSKQPVFGLIDAFYKDVEGFSGANAYRDDRTCVYLRWS